MKKNCVNSFPKCMLSASSTNLDTYIWITFPHVFEYKSYLVFVKFVFFISVPRVEYFFIQWTNKYEFDGKLIECWSVKFDTVT